MSESTRSFTTAVKQKQADGNGTLFDLDGYEMTAYAPDPAQFAMLMASVGRGSTDEDRVAGVINFLVNIVDRRGADHLQHRLMDRNDPFGIDEVQDIIEWLTEEWTGNPTQGPSGSAPSQSPDGPRSTPNTLL